MRRVIVQDDLREAQIRPDSGFSKYIEMLEDDFEAFRKEAQFVGLSACPACGSPDSAPDFEKMGVQYVQCRSCRSSFANPRPSLEDLDRFYAESAAIRYWNSILASGTALARRQFIFNPRATWILESATVVQQDTGPYVDLYAKYPALLEEIAERSRFTLVGVKDPMVDFRPMIDRGVCQLVESLDGGGFSAISAFEVVERLFDPLSFLERVRSALVPGGMIFLTTLSISGLDLRILRGRARNLLPPSHMTLMSHEGIQSLIQRSGFELVELSTPGQLDVSLVLDAIERDPGIELPPFVDAILLRRGAQVQEDFQRFLQQANLSSHVWIAAQKASAA